MASNFKAHSFFSILVSFDFDVVALLSFFSRRRVFVLLFASRLVSLFHFFLSFSTSRNRTVIFLAIRLCHSTFVVLILRWMRACVLVCALSHSFSLTRFQSSKIWWCRCLRLILVCLIWFPSFCFECLNSKIGWSDGLVACLVSRLIVVITCGV